MADRDHLVKSIARGEHGELQIRRRARGRDEPVTDVRLWYRDDDTGEIKPTKNGLPVRDEELPELIATLIRIHKALLSRPAEQAQKPQESRRRHRQRKADVPTGATGQGMGDDELREIEEAF